MQTCEFEPLGDGRQQCKNCKIIFKIKSNLNILRRCDNIPRMSTTEKIVSFKETMKDFKNDKFEQSNDIEKDRRIEICKTCENYNNGTCKLCGCNMNLKSRINAAHCPIGKW